ncbi:MAG: phosphoribosylformylglycinamidine cyclo-ligase [Armatimonadetes bacterium]|nr:phosphoribosylformylglycinamidine cyclo-ligase [Armatimonadota bacterium]
MPDEVLTYQSAGVDIDEAHRVLRAVTGGIQSTHSANVIGGIGGFGGLFRAQFPDIANPILVSSIDGVGTKTKVAAMVGKYDGLGKDIVNHCVNDILCQGAKPIFFLDYFGASHLSGPIFEAVITGLVDACKENDCALIGGETAEMPTVYVDDEIDVVGCIIGVVDADKRLPKKVKRGDAIIGIASSGLHTNGYSLARKALFDMALHSVKDEMPGVGATIGEELLRPHKSYFRAVYPILQDSEAISAIAHITGGGFFDNIPRVLPSDVKAIIDRRTWTPLPIFSMIQECGNVPPAEMYRIFNMGVGMVLFVDREYAPAVVQRINQAGESAAVIGEVAEGSKDVQIV